MTTSLGNHLWQSTVFVAAAWLLTLALRKNRAAVRYAVWLAASVKFLIPFAWLASLGARFEWRSAPALAPVHIPIAVAQISQPFEPVGRASWPAFRDAPPTILLAVLLAVWLCGIAVGLLFWALSHRRVRRHLREAKPLDLHLPIPVLSAPGRMEPGVFGIWKPALLLPEGIAEHLTPAQLEAIMAHELRHVHRRDNLTAAIHVLVETIFWFHPAIWWIRTRLIEERERACDEGVLRSGSEPQVYAESILKVCEFYLSAPAQCAAGVTGGELKKRIEGIMENRFGLKLGFGKRALLAAAALVAVSLPLALGVIHAAQTAKPDYRFEVASIRPGDPSGRMSGPPPPFSPVRFSSESTTIVGLAMKAFGLKQASQIEYQPWMISGHYNVVATIPKGATAADLPIMIQHLLEDRFGLVFHRETRRMAGYELVVAKSGPKLAKSNAPPDEPASKCGDIEMKNGVPQFAKDAGSCQFLTLTTAIWRGRGKTMKNLADDLANHFGVPVVDATGMEGEYDYTLTFTPEAMPASGNVVVAGPPGAAPAEEPRQDEFPANPLLRDALQDQLGLKLQPAKDVPAEVVVLDSARKQPTEN